MIRRALTWLWRQTIGRVVALAYADYLAERESALSDER